MKNQSLIAVITGAAQGLGLETAKELAKKGYTVALLVRNADKLQTAVESLRKEHLDTHGFLVDVTDSAQIEACAKDIQKKFGRVDVLINNAGVFLESNRQTPEKGFTVLNSPPALVLETFETNTLSALRMCQVFVPLMKNSPAPRIVNVSSGMGQLSEMEGGYPGYRLSKSAMNALTKALAAELRDTAFKVNAVCPGWVKTAMGGLEATRSLPEGASGILWAATLPANGPTGGFFRDGKKLDW